MHGKVAQYTLSPRGEVDGLILDDGTEVVFSPHESGQLIYTVRPGDTVTIHGLKARVISEVLGMSITNDATHQTVIGGGPHGAEERGHAPLEVTGQIKQVLHGPQGEVNGVLLDDGTQVRLPPPEVTKLKDMLAPGKPLVVRGPAVSSVLGKLVMAREIGPDAKSLVKIDAPFPGGPMQRMMHAMKGRHGPGPGANANAGDKEVPGGPPGAPPPAVQ